MEKYFAAILGASGYTGVELVRLLWNHPEVHIQYLAAHTQAGQTAAQVFPHLIVAGADLPELIHIDDVNYDEIDVVFCCLPHAASQKIIAAIPSHVRIIDLSADFRLRSGAEYEKWYGNKHLSLELQKDAIYGLSEHYREQIKGARLVANPGCYPTCSLLPLIPLLKAQMIDVTQPIIIDAKSGVSGAGRALAQHLLFNEAAEGMSAYSVNNHRHLGELQQEIAAFNSSNKMANVCFVPHLIPMKRGMMASIYINLRDKLGLSDVRETLAQAYANEKFVHFLQPNIVPTTHQVRGSNYCLINAAQGACENQVILLSVIDNLQKGASGQAVQNMNIMFGFPENTGLDSIAIFP